MVFKCDKCGKEFEKKKDAEKHENNCKKNFNSIEKKHREIILKDIDESEIIEEEMGNDRYLVLTKNYLYFISIGISTGFWGGKKIKSFPIEKITSVDIGKKILASYLEVTAAGMGGNSFAGAGYTAFNENRIFFANKKLDRFRDISKKIRELMNCSKYPDKKEISLSDEIEKLYGLMKRGIITKKEFENKKEKLLE